MSLFLKASFTNIFKTESHSIFLSARRCYHAVPVIDHDVRRPPVDWSRHNGNEDYSDAVRDFIEARDFENKPNGTKLPVISLDTGESTGQIEVNNFVFGVNPRIDILNRNVVWYRACIRAGTASVKRRSEVRGGGRKPWPQKGSGRARHGSIRSPLWRGGGSVKGPKPRDYSYNLPYKVRRLGIRTALSSRLAQGDLSVIENFDDLPSNSMDFEALMQERGFINAMLVDGYENDNLQVLTSDLEKISASHVMFLHVYGILVRHHLVLSLNAVRMLEEKLCEDNRVVTDPNYKLYHENMLLDRSLLYKEYDPKLRILRGMLIPPPPKMHYKKYRASLPLTRQDRGKRH